jgi:hypothetical protein
MTPLFKKLNFKDHNQILVVNAPQSFGEELSLMEESTQVFQSIEEAGEIEFALGFVIDQVAIENFIHSIQPKLVADPIVWIAYPKASSKKYTCAFNRDTGFGILGEYGFEGVRQVAIDEDWSASKTSPEKKVSHLPKKRKSGRAKKGNNLILKITYCNFSLSRWRVESRLFFFSRFLIKASVRFTPV